MALAIVVKLSPLFYVNRIVDMKWWTAALFTAVLVAGLIAPYFLFHNYLYIYRFGAAKGTGGAIQDDGALLIGALFGVLLWYVERRGALDAEDIVGWALVPFAMFLAYKTNAARHLIMALLVPDKRAVRNLAAAGGMMLHSLAPSLIDLNAVLPIATVFLLLGLLHHLQRIGWAVVADDARHPVRTVRRLAVLCPPRCPQGTGAVNDDRLVRAFATVPRERFVGPGPWQVITASGYIETPSDDPAFLRG